MLVNDARTVWNTLRGIICVYKPAEVSCNQVRKTIVSNVCKDLCELKQRPAIKNVTIEGDPTKELIVKVHDSYADHPLVIGPRYQPKDMRCTWASFLGKQTSGVLLLGLNGGTKTVQKICQARPTKAYRIKGKFGEATDNYFKDGKIVEKSTFRHIKRHNIDKLTASMQASHQRKMFELSGVDIQSQAAYELASKGLIRPSDSVIPLLYGIKCIHFESPEFTIEIQCINEYEMYLKTLIHEIGMQLRSTAHCTSLQCIRHSYFNLDQALLRKHWTLQNVLDNLFLCEKTLNTHENLLRKQTAVLQ